MASILKVDKLDPQSGTALEIGTSGDTITVPSGATLDISSATLTPPATLPASSGVNLTALNATNLGSGTVPTARLGTGTASSSVFLAGDNTWAAAGGGKILQVVGNTTTSSSSNTTTTYAATGLSQAITPSATSSKIYVSMASCHLVYCTTQNCTRGETAIYRDIGGAGFSSLWNFSISLGSCGSSSSLHGTAWAEYGGKTVAAIDSPSTTSEVTYTLYTKVSAGYYVSINPYSQVSSVVLMEIDGS